MFYCLVSQDNRNDDFENNIDSLDCLKQVKSNDIHTYIHTYVYLWNGIRKFCVHCRCSAYEQ